MKPATTAKRHFENTKMMVVDSRLEQKVSHQTVADLETFLKPGDLLIVNTASTLPASFRGKVRRSGENTEVRLAAFIGGSANDLRMWSAILFGGGDWRLPTEQRGLPPTVFEGDIIDVSNDLNMKVLKVDPRSPRLLKVEFSSQHLVHELYQEGRPIQYSYHEEDLAVWDQQTVFHGPPVSVEPPSAAFPLTWSLLLKLKKRGIPIAPIIHSAGLSSTGEASLDAHLPLAEYFEVPEETLQKIEATRKIGGRVVALGTSVTRAVESALALGQTSGLTSLKLSNESRVRGIDILITGMHEEGSSHAELMKAFCDCETLKIVEHEANRGDYRSHEFGDWTLLNCAPTITKINTGCGSSLISS